MSAVTKVLVILLVVLCIAFSMTAISITANTANWKSVAEDYRTQAQIAYAAQRSAMASHAAAIASARDSIKNHLSRIGELERESQSSTAEVAAQSGEIALLTGEKRRSDALAQRLTNELGVAQSSRAAIDEQRKQFESRNIELERRNIDLNQRINELTTQVTVLTQQQRQQEQQVHILRDENRKMLDRTGSPVSSGVAAAFEGRGPSGNINPAAAPASPRIAGHVAYVDGNVATLSVGSADRVEVGAVFVIFRGPEYVADVEITDVEPNLSSGRVIRSAPGVSPAKGDRAEDEFHFATPP